MENQTAAQSNVISKTFTVLRAFTDIQMEWGVNELARYLNYPVSSLHRILKTLKDEGLLQISAETDKYKFGPELIRMSSIIFAHADIKAIAQPFMKRASDTINQSVYLGLYYANYKKLSFIEVVHSKNPLQYVLDMGVLQPIHIAASGMVILAFLKEEEIDAVFDAEQVGEEEQITKRKQLEDIRKQKYEITGGERLAGAVGVASPVFDASERVIGCITCVIPIKEFKEEDKEWIANEIKNEAANISKSLGYRN